MKRGVRIGMTTGIGIGITAGICLYDTMKGKNVLSKIKSTFSRDVLKNKFFRELSGGQKTIYKTVLETQIKVDSMRNDISEIKKLLNNEEVQK